MSAPAMYDMRFVFGDNRPLTLTFYNPANPPSDPINLTGAAARLRLSGDATDISSGSGHIAIAGAAGKISIRLTDQEKASLHGKHYRLVVTPAGGDDWVPLIGKIMAL